MEGYEISFFMVTKPLGYSMSDIRFGDEGTEWLMISPEDFVARPDGIERQQRRVRNYLNGKAIE